MHTIFAALPAVTNFLSFSICFVCGAFFVFFLPFVCVLVALSVSHSPDWPLLTEDTQTTNRGVNQSPAPWTEEIIKVALVLVLQEGASSNWLLERAGSKSSKSNISGDIWCIALRLYTITVKKKKKNTELQGFCFFHKLTCYKFSMHIQHEQWRMFPLQSSYGEIWWWQHHVVGMLFFNRDSEPDESWWEYVDANPGWALWSLKKRLKTDVEVHLPTNPNIKPELQWTSNESKHARKLKWSNQSPNLHLTGNICLYFKFCL